MRPFPASPRMVPGHLVALALLLAVAGCATVAPVPPPPASASAGGVGRVLAVRPIDGAAIDDAAWRAALLDGASDPAGPVPQAPASLAEFIVREDAGAIVSIVQSNAAGLRAGDRVVITHPATAPGRVGLARLL